MSGEGQRSHGKGEKMTTDCFTQHKAYIKKLSEGTEVCLFCATEHELDLSCKAAALKAKIINPSVDNSNIMTDNYSVLKECPKCHYQWLARQERPKKCPRCGKWLDYPKEKEMVTTHESLP
jgi:uncharacterized paraquat-inducible protein A